MVPPAAVVDAAEVIDLTPKGGFTRPADPHFWLEPLLLADVGDEVATTLAEVALDRSEPGPASATDLRDRLEARDADLTRAGSL